MTAMSVVDITNLCHLISVRSIEPNIYTMIGELVIENHLLRHRLLKYSTEIIDVDTIGWPSISLMRRGIFDIINSAKETTQNRKGCFNSC
jgi:hypothetical protein